MKLTQQYNLMVDYDAVDIWWTYARSNHRLYFRLMQETVTGLKAIPNYEICIHSLENGYRWLNRSICPKEANAIRQYLISSTRHLIESLRKIRDGQTEEGADLLNQASLEMDLMRYELMNMGI